MALPLVPHAIPLPTKFPMLVLENKDETQPDTPPEDVASSFMPPTELKFKLKVKLNNLIRDSDLPKQGSKLFTSRLQQWNLLNFETLKTLKLCLKLPPVFCS